MGYVEPLRIEPPAYTPPTQEQKDALLRMKLEHQQERDRERARKPAFLQLGPKLPNMDAAVDCFCSCHPRPEGTLHEGGVTCGCQRTPEQRSASIKEFLKDLAEFTEDSSSHDFCAEIESRAKAEGAHMEVVIIAAPFVVTGTVDGRAFYLRERHGSYRICMADDTQETDLWGNQDATTVLVAEGDEAELRGEDGQSSADKIVALIVNSVRIGLRRLECPHTSTTVDSDFCPRCGTQLCAIIPATLS